MAEPEPCFALCQIAFLLLTVVSSAIASDPLVQDLRIDAELALAQSVEHGCDGILATRAIRWSIGTVAGIAAASGQSAQKDADPPPPQCEATAGAGFDLTVLTRSVLVDLCPLQVSSDGLQHKRA